MKCLIADTESLLERVYRLRYEAYRRDESIAECAGRLFKDTFDQAPNSISVLAQSNSGEDAASVRISVVTRVAGWNDSPARHVFGDQPVLQHIAAESYVEASRLCFAAQVRRDAFVCLTGYMAALAEFHNTEWLVACPRVEHVESYQRMFGFKPLAEARQYFGVKFQTQLLGVRRSELAHHVQAARPMLAAWANALQHLAAIA